MKERGAQGNTSSAAQPPFRSYVSLELPFCVAPAVTAAESASQLAVIEDFLPAQALRPCLEDYPVQRARWRDRRKKQAAALVGGAGTESVEGSQTSRSKRARHDAAEGSPSSATPPPNATASSSGGAAGTDLLTGIVEDYNTEEIFTCWRPMDWGGEEALEADKTAGGVPSSSVPYSSLDSATAAAHVKAQRRREVFPSTVPQLLLNGFYRNDLLARVTVSRRIRRLRDAETGEVVREEEIIEQGGSNVGGGGREKVEIVGVVSREVELSRPADFSFSLFTDAHMEQAPDLCGLGDTFPPPRYLTDRAPFEVRYELGRDANTSVQQQQLGDLRTATDAMPVQWVPEDYVNALSVAPDDISTPPPLSQHQRLFLKAVGSSIDGSNEADPAEVRVASSLLARRPVWNAQDLTDAMLESGQCPRLYFNKHVLNCLTYLITNGPFNRLRIRMDFDPYATSQVSAVYQRVIIRLARTSEVGTMLRDLSRSEHMAGAVEIALGKRREEIAQYKRSVPDGEYRSTFIEQLCRTAAGGFLYLSFQFIDVLDNKVFRDIIDAVHPATNMDMSCRVSRCGWVSEAGYNLASSHFVDALGSFLKDEIIPLLKLVSGAMAKEVGSGGSGAGSGETSLHAQRSATQQQRKEDEGSVESDEEGEMSTNASLNSSFSRSSSSTD